MISFLKKLQKNNRKGWIDENRDAYHLARKDFENLVKEVILAIASFDSSIKNTEAKSCIFRINRDVRFSKNKSPYKTNFAAYFHEDGKKGEGAGYYLHMEPGASFLAAGIWMPEPKVCAAIRQEIDYQFEEWNSMLKKSKFKKQFPDGFNQSMKLIRPPKGYEETNPAIEYLKLKSFIVQQKLPDEVWQNKNRISIIKSCFEASKDLVDFLNRARD